MGLHRSLLYVPANRPDLIGKIERFAADAYILDLEDGVPSSEKEAARRTMTDLAPTLMKAGRVLHARINPVHTPWHRADLDAALGCGIARLHVPKIGSAADLREVDHRMVEMSVRWGIAIEEMELYPTLESSRALLDADPICSASGLVAGVLLGGDDLTAEWGTERTPEGREIEHARSLVLLVACAHGALPIDATYPFHRDLDGCASDAARARALGFKAKQAIHPAQCPIINQAFTPTAAELERARAIVAAAESARVAGRGTSAAAGTQIDAAVEKSARRVLAWADEVGRPRLGEAP